VDFFDQMEVTESIHLPRSRRCSTDIDGSNRSFLAENDGATREGLKVTGMSNLDPQNIGDGVKPFHCEDIIKKGKRVSMIPRIPNPSYLPFAKGRS